MFSRLLRLVGLLVIGLLFVDLAVQCFVAFDAYRWSTRPNVERYNGVTDQPAPPSAEHVGDVSPQ